PQGSPQPCRDRMAAGRSFSPSNIAGKRKTNFREGGGNGSEGEATSPKSAWPSAISQPSAPLAPILPITKPPVAVFVSVAWPRAKCWLPSKLKPRRLADSRVKRSRSGPGIWKETRVRPSSENPGRRGGRSPRAPRNWAPAGDSELVARRRGDNVQRVPFDLPPGRIGRREWPAGRVRATNPVIGVHADADSVGALAR